MDFNDWFQCPGPSELLSSYVKDSEMSSISDDNNQPRDAMSLPETSEAFSQEKDLQISNISEDEISARTKRLFCDISESSSLEFLDENQAKKSLLSKTSDSCSYASDEFVDENQAKSRVENDVQDNILPSASYVPDSYVNDSSKNDTFGGENQVKTNKLLSESSEPCSYKYTNKKILSSEYRRFTAKHPFASDVSDASDDEDQVKVKKKKIFCKKCKKNKTAKTKHETELKNIVLYIKSLLEEAGESDLTSPLNSIEDNLKKWGKVNLNKLNCFLNRCDGKCENEIERTYDIVNLEIPSCCIRSVKCVTHNKTRKLVELGPVTEEECSKITQKERFATNHESTIQESLNKKKISFFFPKLLAKIALESKADTLIENLLQSKNSISFLYCKAKLALNFNNIDAAACFFLAAVEVEENNLNQAFEFYKHAVLSLHSMIFQDRLFPFLSESELIEDDELFKNYERFFLYSQVKTALMSVDNMISFSLELDSLELDSFSLELDSLELDSFSLELDTGIDETEAK